MRNGGHVSLRGRPGGFNAQIKRADFILSHSFSDIWKSDEVSAIAM